MCNRGYKKVPHALGDPISTTFMEWRHQVYDSTNVGLPEGQHEAQQSRIRRQLYSNMDEWPPGEEPNRKAPIWHPGIPIRPEFAKANSLSDASPKWGTEDDGHVTVDCLGLNEFSRKSKSAYRPEHEG